MATITFRRSSNINDVPVIDGQIVFDTARNIILMDNGNTRNQYAGATQLISTTPEATSTNAYNALATNQLFLQKTTVLDTKANALAVTQKYIPLGCLAFKEALGTTDYSRVGNGTISGGLVYLNNQMNNQLTANGNKFYFDYHDGEYGYNTNANRGADTFVPFKQGTDFVVCSVTNFWNGNAYRGYGRLTYTDPDGIVTGGSADSNGSDARVNFTTKTMTGTMGVGDGGCSLTVYARITGYYFVGGGTTSTHFQEGDKIAEWGSIAQPNTMWRIAFDKQIYT